jgi:hypothetical protein
MTDDARRIRYHFVLVDYLCWPVSGELQAGSDVDEAVFVDPGALEPFDLTPKAQSVIERALALGQQAAPSPRQSA